FRVPVLLDRLVVDRLRPRFDAARTREMLSSCGCSSNGWGTAGTAGTAGVSSRPSLGVMAPNVCPSSKLDICPPTRRFPLPTCPSSCRHPPARYLLAQRLRRAVRLLRLREDGALGAWP